MLPFRHEKRLSANQGSGDDVNVIFQVADVRSLQQRPQHATDIKKKGDFYAFTKSESLEFKVPIVRLATGCVSPPRERR